MTHFGAICNPSPSHVMTMVSLGHELEKRGHRFTLFGQPDLAGVAEENGISFRALDNSQNLVPPRKTFIQALGAGLSSLYVFKLGMGETALYCEQAPDAMKDAGVQCVIGDQLIIAARTVAERLGVPFVTICSSIPNSTDPQVPPFFLPWRYRPAWWARGRNWLVYSLGAFFSTPISRKLNSYRTRWGLQPHRKLDDTFSPLAQITQLVPEFDFPYKRRPANLYHVGPYQRADDQRIDFPYERLDGRPLIFAVLGTVLGDTPGIWKTIAESCLGLEAQLVISLGGRGRVEDHQDLPGQPVVVCFAPQRELLKRVALMITHGGLNSVMETLAQGVPLISLHAPAGDQPGVAMRVADSGAGETLALNQCRVETLRPLVRRVWTDPSYRAKASVLQRAILKTGGIHEAADIVERIGQAN